MWWRQQSPRVFSKRLRSSNAASTTRDTSFGSVHDGDLWWLRALEWGTGFSAALGESFLKTARVQHDVSTSLVAVGKHQR